MARFRRRDGRQGKVVQLAVGVFGHFVQLPKQGRHHVIGQAVGKIPPQLRFRHRFGNGIIPGQAFVGRLPQNAHGGAADAGKRGHAVFDLRNFEPLAVQLHHAIRPPEDRQFAARLQTDQVSRAEQPAIAGVFQVFFGVQVRAV